MILTIQSKKEKLQKKIRRFLKKINCQEIMNIEQAAIEYNKRLYPDEKHLTFINYTSLTNDPEFGNSLNWRKVGKWVKEGLVRTKKVTVLKGNGKIYDPNKDTHKGKEVVEVLYYAREDFLILSEVAKMRENLREVAQYEEIETKEGKKKLVRDFRKEDPDLNEMEILSESLGTFIAWRAMQKLEAQAENLSKENKELFTKILWDAIPNIQEKAKNQMLKLKDRDALV